MAGGMSVVRSKLSEASYQIYPVHSLSTGQSAEKDLTTNFQSLRRHSLTLKIRVTGLFHKEKK
jgi:hypothetical protein